MKKISAILSLFLFGTIIWGCDDSSYDYLVKIKTVDEEMLVLLYEETPRHKVNFLKLAKDGTYNGTTWHRVIKNFMIQGGDISQKTGKMEREEDRISAEIVPGFYHIKGALAAARQPDQVNPDRGSSASQFYIVHGLPYEQLELEIDQLKLNSELSLMFESNDYDSIKQLFIEAQTNGATDAQINQMARDLVPYVEKERNINLRRNLPADRIEAYKKWGGAPHLDYEYTVFGRVVEGHELIDKIANVIVGPTAAPAARLEMTMEIVKMKKTEVTQKYGYIYPVE